MCKKVSRPPVTSVTSTLDPVGNRMHLKNRAHLLALPPSFHPSTVRDIAAATGLSYPATLKFLAQQRRHMLRTPIKGEKCGAHARSTGKPCRAPALANGRCRMHGGLSTGAASHAGQIRSYGHVRQAKPPVIEPQGPTHPDLLEHIAAGGELTAQLWREIARTGRLDALQFISALELAEIVIVEDLGVLSDSVLEGLIDVRWFDGWLARKQRQVEQQQRVLLKLRGVEGL